MRRSNAMRELMGWLLVILAIMFIFGPLVTVGH